MTPAYRLACFAALLLAAAITMLCGAIPPIGIFLFPIVGLPVFVLLIFLPIIFRRH